jgi:hypothetical protein
MFAAKTTSYLSEAAERCFTRVAPALPANIMLGLKGLQGTNTLAYYKKSVNHSHKKFYSTGPWGQCYKTFYGRKLRLFIIS